MIIRITHWQAKPNTDHESRKIWETHVGPIWKAQKGMIRAHLLSDPKTNARITFSVWQSAADYEAFLKSDDLARVVGAYDHIYTDDGRPRATEWSVLTDDWHAYA